MDKFVIRKPRSSPSSPSKRGNCLKQATLESLKGVVIIEELERAKVVLERSDTSIELKVDTLQHLKRKTPAKEILIKTHIGKTVHKLCKAKDADVAAAAKEVYGLWKDHVLSKVNRPLLEVKCDPKTQGFRDTARRMIFDALMKTESGDSSSEDQVTNKEEIQRDEEKSKTKKKQKDVKDSSKVKVEALAEYIERDVYQATRRLVNKAYRRTIRTLVFTFKHQSDVRVAVKSSTLSVEELVKQHLKR
ncbi:transcription elongation factor A N-terminal and central domain-containing protein 2-like [Homarus americanus]|uniref:transcription elongation factor A N-terminal and central domain-containing protein 2-like n=1 Tax=Homarus americanus TaxID=6706 RepID=UPI001C4706EA|nr:transcription elongation factor A N-terminal and central domain-containing protein 2-like [Homarus americanus]